MTSPKTHHILGLQFFGGTSREAVEEITRRGGLLAAPAAPSMIALCRDADYRRALLSAEIAIADSGFMVLLWKLFTGQAVPRISGLEHVKRLLEHESMREPGAVVWVVATEDSRAKLVGYLVGGTSRACPPRRVDSVSGEHTRLACPGGRPADQLSNAGGSQPEEVWEIPEEDQSSPTRGALAGTRGRVRSPAIYIAPKYGRPVEDEALLALVREKRPRHVVIAVGGGIQDQLGQYLLEQLDYRPAVHCIGAAVGFITGDQVRIPDWADKYYLGWFFRSLAQPKVFIPRFWSARRLPWLIWKYRERLPPLGA